MKQLSKKTYRAVEAFNHCYREAMVYSNMQATVLCAQMKYSKPLRGIDENKTGEEFFEVRPNEPGYYSANFV